MTRHSPVLARVQVDPHPQRKKLAQRRRQRNAILFRDPPDVRQARFSYAKRHPTTL